ncbi:MAG: alpha/beta hydrolase, partial [Deltaproteobacteria bacterium]|nr:alpha/beta hydrolase [Deltaproteobacteria bacterium]
PVARERVPPAAPSGAPERVSFATEDGVTIVATLRRAPVRGAPAVVLVHQLSSNRSEWAPVVERLSAAPGLTTLSIDLRGHGESVVGPSGPLDWHTFSPDDYRAMAKDVSAAVAYLRVNPGTTPSRIAVVGSSIGSSAALLAAAADPSIGAVALVSPGRAYRGIDAITPASRLGERPLLAIAAQGEAAAVQSAQDMARVARAGRYVASRGSTHGVGQFTDDPASLDALISFLRDPGAASEQAPALDTPSAQAQP